MSPAQRFLALGPISAVLLGCLAADTGAGGGAGGGDGAGGGVDPVKTQKVTVTWKLQKADGSADVCPTNYSKVKVQLSNSDAFRWFNTSRQGELVVKVFDCTAGTATIEVPISGPVGTSGTATPWWSATMAITEPTGEVTMQSTESQLFDLSAGPKTIAFTVYPNAGFLITVWGLSGVMSGTSLSCAAAAVDQVRVTWRHEKLPDGSPGDLKETTATFPCSPTDEDWAYLHVDCIGCVGGGQSPALAYGRYLTKLEALSAGAVVGTRDYDPNASGEVVKENTFSGVSNSGGNVARSDIDFERSFFVTITNR